MDNRTHAGILSLMSLNLRFGLAEDGPNNWIHRRHAYAPLLAAFPSDFFAFQEANDFQIDFLADLLPDHGYIGRRMPAPQRWQNNVIFHHKRWQCVHHEHFFLSSTPHKPSRFRGSRWPRQCTLGVFRNRCRCLVVVNTHLDFAESVQVRSAHLIRKKMGRHDRKGPSVLMGDFNTIPGSACYEVFTSPPDRQRCLRNAFPPPYTGTHHGFDGGEEGDPIDWVLYRGALTVRRACVITERFGGIFPSDHYPLVVRFES